MARWRADPTTRAAVLQRVTAAMPHRMLDPADPPDVQRGAFRSPEATDADRVLLEGLEHEVERRPSLLAKVGLSAVQVLAAFGEGLIAPSQTTRLMAVGFTDLEGFTRFTDRAGDAAAADLLHRHYREAALIVRRHDGRLVKRLGDGLLLSFLEPEQGVRGMLELIANEPAPLRVRAGLHYGQVLVHGDDVLGHVVNVAARLTQAAHGGELLATADLRAAASGLLPASTFGRVRRRKLKGVAERVEFCRVNKR